MQRKLSDAARSVAAWLCLLAALCGCAGGSDMTLAPVSTSGSIQSTAVARRNVDGSSESTIQERATLNLDSFIWYPWFIRVGSNLDVAYEQGFGEESGSALRGSARGTVSVLPQSKYPVTLSAAHIDSRASGEFGATDFTRDRASLNARAVLAQNLRGGIRASWNRTRDDEGDESNSQNFDLNLSKTFTDEDAFLGLNSINLDAGLDRSRFTDDDPLEDDFERDTAFVRLSTHSEPFENLFYDSLITATLNDFSEESESLRRFALQGVTTVQWRPEDKPYVVTGTLRTLTEDIDDTSGGETSSSSTKLAAGTVGLRWPLDNRLSFNVGLRGSFQDVKRDEGGELGEDGLDDGQRIDATVLAGVNYISEARDLAGFRWHWTANGQTENGVRAEEGGLSRDRISLGHRFERPIEGLIFVPVRFSFDQDVDLDFDTSSDDTITVGASHGLALSYSHSEAASTTVARLSLRDRRDFIGERHETQSLRARFSRTTALDRRRRLQGDLTAQAVRTVDEDDSDIFLTASGTVSYQERDLFGIENLRLRSELSLNALSLDDLLAIEREEGTERDVLRNDWRNVLSYRIGRLTAELEGTGFQRDEGLGYLVLVRLRRDFGGGF